MKSTKRIAPGQIIALSFLTVILLGALLLTAPFMAEKGVRVGFVDALFTSTSAVCVTGLVVVDTADTFNAVGSALVALLIQVGGLGVTTLGVGLMILAGRRIDLRERALVRDSWNLSSLRGVAKLMRAVLTMTVAFEVAGALLSFLVFSKDYPLGRAVGISVFHSIASFNNAGFDILGGLTNLIPYRDNVLLNLTTAGLIIFGGLGFLVILDVGRKRSFKKLTLHAKVVLVMTGSLIAAGTLLLKATDDVSWLGAFFQSVSTRTAGFSTYNLGTFTDAGLFVMTVLMFIGASPGSTGGGIKTTTFFVLIQSIRSAARGRPCQAFKRSIGRAVVAKAFLVTLLALVLVVTGTFVLCLLEPEYTFLQLLFEMVSAFGTVGLSTGITPQLGAAAKLMLTAVMYVGRLGPMTIATLWAFKQEAELTYSEESITIG